LESNRDVDYYVFIDIAPEKIFITLTKKENINWSGSLTEEEKLNGKKELHLRRYSKDVHKCDISYNNLLNKKINRMNDFISTEITKDNSISSSYEELLSQSPKPENRKKKQKRRGPKP